MWIICVIKTIEVMDDVIKSTFKYNLNKINLDDDIRQNVISINKIDYFAYWINPLQPGNKGAHSYIFALYVCQDFISLDDSTPLKVIKISNVPDLIDTKGCIKKNDNNNRFYREIEALQECKKNRVENIISIDFCGHIGVKGSRNSKDGERVEFDKFFPFYMMDFATHDLKQYLENQPDIKLYNRLEICLQIAYGLYDLNLLGYYHRDLKPDNILLINQQWKIGDLGLIAYREQDWDRQNELIGPKGWLSPEAMNKYLSTKNEGCFDCRIDSQSDIFQLGKVFWYIIQGNAPIGNIVRSDFKEENEPLYVLIRTMLNHSKKKRIKSMKEVVTELKRIIETS